jgi:hypothetical protein
VIPRWLWGMASLKAAPRFLLAYLWTWAKADDPDPFVWRTLEQLVADTGQPKRVIERQLEALSSAGLIVRARRHGRLGWDLVSAEIVGSAGNVGPPETSDEHDESGGRTRPIRRTHPPESADDQRKKTKKSEESGSRPAGNVGPDPLEELLESRAWWHRAEAG